MAFSRSRKAQSLLEVLVAIGLLVFIAGTSFSIISQSFRESFAGNQQVRARQILSESFAAVRQMRNRDYALLAAGPHGLALNGSDWTFAGTEDVTEGTYTRTVTVTAVDGNQSDVRVQVAWSPLPGRTASVRAATRLANWLVPPIPAGSNCTAGTVSGDWAHPVVLGSADIGSGNQGTDVVIKGNYVFESGVAASAAKPDLFVFDVSNPASPQLVKSVETGSNGINSLFLIGNYLYAASSNDAKEFQVFDASDPPNTRLLTSADLSGSANALSVLAAVHWAVVGRANGSASEVVFYDVTNPAVPSVVASFDEAGDINDFATDGQYLYAANEGGASDIVVYDVTDPLQPMRVASVDVPGLDESVSIAYQDPDILLVGSENDELVVLNAADVNDLTVRSVYNTGGEIQDITCATGQLGFLATTNSIKEFLILNISDLENIGEYSSFNFPQVASGAAFDGNKVYVSVRSNDALRIITAGP